MTGSSGVYGGRRREGMNSAPLPTKQRVLSRIVDNQDQIKALGVKRLGIFGSVARNDAGVDSDVDVLVEFEPEQKTFDNFMRLAFLLEDLLQRPVEVLTAESLSPYLRHYILKDVEYGPLAK
jgi:predicted nucleotidyltransferase